MRAALARDDVRGLMREDLVARPAMHQRRRHVAHGARGHEHGGLLAEQIGDALAQQVHGRIVADLLVADFRARHRLPHRRRRPGLGVRQQIDADRRRLGIARGRGVVHGVSRRLLEELWSDVLRAMHDGTDFDVVRPDSVEDQVRLKTKAPVAGRQIVDRLTDERKIGKQSK